MSYSGKLCLSVSELSYQYPAKKEPVFQDLNFQLYSGQTIGLLGLNGCGKSTLLKLIQGQLEPDTGSCERHFYHFFYLEQEACAYSELSVELFLLQSYPNLADLYQRLQKMEALDLPDPLAYADTMAAFSELDGYEVLDKVRVILSRLGFSSDTLQQPVSLLSGGQRRLLKIASGFILEPELYLLDEPTNYLDQEGIEYLIDAIQSHEGTFIIISHDRWFLDQIAENMLAFQHEGLKFYRGNYSIFWQTYQDDFLKRLRKKEKLEKEISKLKVIERSYKQWSNAKEKTKIGAADKGFIGARAARLNKKAIQAKERVQGKIETLQSEKPWIEKVHHLWFKPVEQPMGTVLAVQQLSLAFQEPLFESLSFSLAWGEKMVIQGENGSGKTSLLKCLMREMPFEQGKVLWDGKARIGYLPQLLTIESRNVCHLFLQNEYQQALTLLACFKVPAEAFWRPCVSLSPGQQQKVRLVRLILNQPNVLILDEPTTHLDYMTIEQLEEMIVNFQGSLILISHDQYLAKRTTQTCLRI